MTGVLGIDSIHMLWLIKEWAERNRTFHNQIRQHISDCHWPSLAAQVCRDLKELLNVADDRETAVKYEEVLISIRDEYFIVMARDDPQHWLPNEKARNLLQEKLARENKGDQKLFEVKDILGSGKTVPCSPVTEHSRNQRMIAND